MHLLVDQPAMNISSKFEEKNALYKVGGVIGRKAFVINQFFLILLAFILVLPCFFIRSKGLILVVSLMGFPMMFFAISNILKRVRDIRGTIRDEIVWAMGAAFLFLVPYVNFVLLLILSLLQGKITSGNHQDCLSEEDQISYLEASGFDFNFLKKQDKSSATLAPSLGKKDGKDLGEQSQFSMDFVGELERLSFLHEKGALNQQEFQEAKSALIRRHGSSAA